MDTRKLLSSEEFVDRIQGQDIAIVITEADFLPREVFDKAPRLRFVGVCRADVGHVDVQAATEHGVLVVNTPGRNSAAVAELTLGLMLGLVRNIPAAHRMVCTGGWVDPTAAYFSLRGSELGGKTVGIVGFGAVGQQVARRVSAFETNILVYDPYVGTDRIEQFGAMPQELDKLMEQSDFVTLHCSTGPGTVGLLSAQMIALMKPAAYLVNTASAYVVDEEALVRALRERRIAGAAFDVYDTWPVRPDSPLMKLDNVILTPHIGGATNETIVRHSQMMADDVERFLRGERPENLVNPEGWE
jgi:D-3-phosphoglycerate dehydrogenase